MRHARLEEKRRQVESLSGTRREVEKEKIEDRKRGAEGEEMRDCSGNNRVHVILNPVAGLSYCGG